MPLPSRDGSETPSPEENVLSKRDAKRASVRARERATGTKTNGGYGAAFPSFQSKRAVCQEYAKEILKQNLLTSTPYAHQQYEGFRIAA